MRIRKKEFSMQELCHYTPISARDANQIRAQRTQRGCKLKYGVMDEYEVWVCEAHKEFYYLEQFKTQLESLIRAAKREFPEFRFKSKFSTAEIEEMRKK